MAVMAPLTQIGLQRILDALREAIHTEGSARAFARKHGFSAAFVSDVTLCKRFPSPRLCEILGFRREVGRTIQYIRERR